MPTAQMVIIMKKLLKNISLFIKYMETWDAKLSEDLHVRVISKPKKHISQIKRSLLSKRNWEEKMSVPVKFDLVNRAKNK